MYATLALLALGTPQDVRDARAEAPPAAIRMIDVNGDGRYDRLRLGADGALSVSLSRGTRRFEPVVQDLPALPVAHVLVGDLNGDGNEDLYLVSPQDNVALVGDRTGRFVDATHELGLVDAGAGRSAELVDLDRDGSDDVLLHNRGGDVVFWGGTTGVYERDPATGPVGGREESGGGGPSIGDVTQIALPTSCATTLRDATSGMCLIADSTPTFGRLYPLGPELDITPDGDVHTGDDVLVGSDGSGSVFLENYDNALHRGTRALYGTAALFPFDFSPGVMLEAGPFQSGGFFANGDYAVIWSPGDQTVNGRTQTVFAVFDEDDFSSGEPQLQITTPSFAPFGGVIQPTDRGGLVKAACHVDGLSSPAVVTRQFNLLPGGGVISMAASIPGRYDLDFGVDVSDRFVTVTLAGGIADTAAAFPLSGSPTIVRVQSLGGLEATHFFLVLY